MPDDLSPNLGLPYLLPAQAQKHVTHNEALALLDLVVQLAVLTRGLTLPPGTPAEGDRHIVGAGASGAWAGQDGRIAVFRAGLWAFVPPRAGWRAEVMADRTSLIHDGSSWRDGPAMLGVNASPDATNRLAVAGAATLLTHAGAGHQLKINKAAAADTASLLFQTGWSGRAEMGLAGSDAFAVRVSAAGAAWTTALSADPATGIVSLPQGAAVAGPVTGLAVTQGATDATAGRLIRAQDGWLRGTALAAVALTGGVPTGGILERGSNANGDYIRMADGTQICSSGNISADVTTAAGSMFRSAAQTWTFPMAFLATTSTTVVSGGGNNSTTHWSSARVLSTTQAEVGLFAPTSTTGRSVRLVAIGRWA